MDYAPNVDAVIYFVAEVWPKIVLECPDISFIIAGQRPVKQVLELQSDKIKITGFVPDLKVMYQQASVVVSPLRFGGWYTK
jgi:glycosyltransferase involved in cell wall biosynthesis